MFMRGRQSHDPSISLAEGGKPDHQGGSGFSPRTLQPMSKQKQTLNLLFRVDLVPRQEFLRDLFEVFDV